MRYICLFLFVSAISNVYGQDIKSFNYCYTAKDAIYVYSAAKKKAELVVKGTDPYLAPDGSKLAFTANGANGDRQVETIDLATKQKTLLHTNNNNCYGPVWSPDGQYIAYNAFIKSTWFICIIDKDNHTPVVITKSLNYSGGAYSPTWSADSKKIVVHNMDTVFVFSLDSRLLEKIPVNSFATATDITSASKFTFTSDWNKIVFDCSVDEQGFDEPPGVIFIFDRKAKTTKRLTPKGYWCAQPFLKGDRIYFSASKIKSKSVNVYSMKQDGSDLKLELGNCTDFTAAIK